MKMKEDDTTEFKRKITKDMMKTAVAYSNTRGGTIYIGVENDGTVIGVDDTDEVSKLAAQLLADTIRPDITMLSSVHPMKIGDADVVVITVQEGTSKPYYLRDKGLRSEGVYIRSGPVSVPAPESLILKMIRENSHHAYESVVSLNQDLSFKSTSEIFRGTGLDLADSQMRSMGFMKGEQFTNLAYLLSDQYEQGIKLAVFDNRSKSTFRDRMEIKGSVLEQAERAYGFIEKYNPLRTEISGLRRVDYRAFPEAAVREVLINAIVHRDYSVNGSILVSVFGDSIAVSSVGGLNPDIGYDDIMLGISSLRNPRLAAVFYRLGMIETYGTGIPRIMGAYKDNTTQPKIEISTNVFKITLPAMETTKTDNTEARTVLKLFDDAELISRSDVERAMGVSRSKASAVLSGLVAEEKIKTVGAGRNTRYRLK
ncbi:MAG: putative DNA binding domain-containing protein [Methanomassiliicoccaceae archaeon]|nr:putative DNA binding domain-containing protein [Methanomassiliicoccaceae archaeon]